MEREDLLASSSEENTPKPSPLVSLEKDLKFYCESIYEVAQEIVQEGLSLYPIFVAHQHEVRLGEQILNREELGTQWHIHASTLEEFTEKGIIKRDKKEAFIQKYKSVDEFMCLFVIVPEGANFVFFPYERK